MRTCNSIRGFVRPSASQSVGWLVGWSVCHAWVEEWENTHFHSCPPIRNWWPCIQPCLCNWAYLETLKIEPAMTITISLDLSRMYWLLHKRSDSQTDTTIFKMTFELAVSTSECILLFITVKNTKTRLDKWQSSRGRLGRSSNAKTAGNSKMWQLDWQTDQHGKVESCVCD